jgi:hypothetical protein
MMVTMVLASVLLFTACDKPNVDNNTVVIEQTNEGVLVQSILVAKVGDYILDEQGRKYKKITNSNKINEDVFTTEVWERVDPLDKKRWYAPSLGSFVWTNQPVIFNSLFRMEGEDYPTF